MSDIKTERVQKVMSQRGICSRRAAERKIADGRVKVNGRLVALGDKMDPQEPLTVDGREYAVKNKPQLYVMLNKPRGVLSTARDDRGRKTVIDMVADLPRRVVPVGRLDYVSEGLILLSSDGKFVNKMTHPRYEVPKTYRVTVRPKPTDEQLDNLAAGIVLDDGDKTLPASVTVVRSTPERAVLEVVLREGKNRQIRRMCEAAGLSVARLERVAMGSVRLGSLPLGKWRELTDAEVNALWDEAK